RFDHLGRNRSLFSHSAPAVECPPLSPAPSRQSPKQPQSGPGSGNVGLRAPLPAGPFRSFSVHRHGPGRRRAAGGGFARRGRGEPAPLRNCFPPPSLLWWEKDVFCATGSLEGRGTDLGGRTAEDDGRGFAEIGERN